MAVPYKIGVKKKQAFLEGVEAKLKYQDFPPQIIVESTAFCNLRCAHCGHATMKRTKGHMKEDLWKKIIDEIAQKAPQTEVWPTFYGEAFILKQKMTDRIRYAVDKGLTNIVLNTNGALLTDDIINAIIDSGLHRLLFSMDGFKKETFEKIRVGADRDEVFHNAERALQIRDQRGSKMRVEMQYSLMDENESEVEEFRQYWLSRGAIVKTREKLTWVGTKEASNLYKNMDRIACPWAVRACAIQWNGDLVACAVDYEGGFVAGNVQNDTIEHIWNTKHRDFVDLHLKHKFDQLPALCRNCLDWQVGGGAYHEFPDAIGTKR